MAAAVGSAVGSAAGQVVGDVVKSTVGEASKSIFGALGNLMNEGYEKRKAEYQEKLKEDQMKLANNLTIELEGAKTENEIRRAYAEYQNKLNLLNQGFENDMKKLDKELEQKNKELERKYKVQDVNIEKLDKYRDYLQQQIYIAPNPETRQALTNQLTSTYANQAYGGTGKHGKKRGRGKPKIPENLIEKTYIWKPNPELQRISDRYFSQLGMPIIEPNSRTIIPGRRYE